ncbi:MAG: DoxX family membrane protein [Bacteroidota bacterium]
MKNKMKDTPETTSTIQKIARIILGLFMVFAGIGHLSIQRQEFQAQVPHWIPLHADLVVLLSGIVEILLGLAMLFWRKERWKVGLALAIFYVLIFPGNIAQYTEHRNAFGLDTDTKRLVRLFFQPVLILWALWSTGAWKHLFNKRN